MLLISNVSFKSITGLNRETYISFLVGTGLGPRGSDIFLAPSLLVHVRLPDMDSNDLFLVHAKAHAFDYGVYFSCGADIPVTGLICRKRIAFRFAI